MVTYSVTYNKVGKGFNRSNWEVCVVYWNDFNFNFDFDLSNDEDAELIYSSTSSFNLSGFQVWNEVVWFAFRIWRQPWPAPAYTQYFNMEFMRSSNWSSWSVWWRDSSSIYWESIPSEDWRSWAWHAYYAWVDDDEIRTWYTYYKFHIYSDDWEFNFYSPTFTVSSLSFDSTLHSSWYIWIEWRYLCYTDWTWWEMWNPNQWYKHKIKYDSSFSEYVWTSYSWKIWLQTDVIRRIYYIDEYWYKRRTYEAQNRSGYPSWQWRYVWTSYRGRIWCPWNYDYADAWYWHLCFVNQNWYLMRILNWDPNW